MALSANEATAMSGGWGCPHETNGLCSKVNNLPCNPGMKGCTLAGRFRFANEDKNTRFYENQARKSVPNEHEENKDLQ